MKNKAYFILESTAITTPVKTYDKIIVSSTLEGRLANYFREEGKNQTK
jgi:hypothetical protein